MASALTDLDRARAWQQAHERVVALTRSASTDALAKIAPATPEWTCKDLVGHMAGVGLETLAGTAVAGHPPEWTARTVTDRADRSMESVLAEWIAGAAGIEELVATGQDPSLLIDLAVHEQDLRGALGEPGGREGPAADTVLGFYADLFAAGARELPALRVVTGELVLEIGSGPPVGALEVDPFELSRAAAGRRSAAQVRSWAWPVDPAPWLPVLSKYGSLRDTDLPE